MKFFPPIARTNRKQFLINILKDYLIIFIIISIFAVGVFLEQKSPEFSEHIKNLFSVLGGLFILIVAPIKNIRNTIGRLRDLDRPGGHLVLLLIPIYNIYLFLMLFLLRGSLGSNTYGDDPIFSK